MRLSFIFAKVGLHDLSLWFLGRGYVLICFIAATLTLFFTQRYHLSAMDDIVIIYMAGLGALAWSLLSFVRREGRVYSKVEFSRYYWFVVGVQSLLLLFAHTAYPLQGIQNAGVLTRGSTLGFIVLVSALLHFLTLCWCYKRCFLWLCRRELRRHNCL